MQSFFQLIEHSSYALKEPITESLNNCPATYFSLK